MRLGLIVNPFAGIGGRVGLMGSDGREARERAVERGATPRAALRVAEFLAALGDDATRCEWRCWGGAMGADSLAGIGLEPVIVGQPAVPSSERDTEDAARALVDVDLLLFAGGDGTARDVLKGAQPHQLMLGIPAGVKMQSGVFAATPLAAATVVRGLIHGRLTQLEEREVRDLDEVALRAGRVQSTRYGSMRVPAVGGFVLQTKVGGRESEPLVLEEIAADVASWAADYELLIVGPGSTTHAVKRKLCGAGTLLGIDVIQRGTLLARDANEIELLATLDTLRADQRAVIIITPTGGQGMLLGRGNQPLSPRVLRRVGIDHVKIVATRSKVNALAGLLWVDTGDADVDRDLRGVAEIIVGFEQRLLHRIA